jgi:hypothetical protein
MSQPSITFKRILEAARARKGESGTDTTVVIGHLAQMRMFMLRQGLEFYPRQDTFGFRKQFLSDLIESNEIDMRLEGIIDDFLIDGKGLFYFRPVGDSYRVLWFSRDNYRAYYDPGGNLEEIDLIYEFETRQTTYGVPGGPNQGSKKYVRLRVRRDTIQETISDQKPTFEVSAIATGAMEGRSRTVVNTLGFIPAIEAFNNMESTGANATGEFDWLSEHIVAHNEMVRNIRDNITFYGNPTLVSSRPKQDLVESGGEAPMRPTIASQAGFGSPEFPSTRTSSPTGFGRGRDGSLRVPRIIANLEATDRVAYITPDAVSGDQNLYARQYREEIRSALGGVDELGVSSGATAYEIKSLFGRAATTASRKCRGLLTYGLCKLLALIVFHEEKIFRESFAIAAGIQKPAAPIQEQFASEEEFLEAVQIFQDLLTQYDGAVEEGIRTAVQNQELPPGVVGLIPDGDRRVEWRWKGPVFEDSTEDILNSSIVVRNLQELGVNSVEALRYLFPDKTDEERSSMLNGYPFRMVQATQQSIGTFLSLVANMREIPHPQAPDLPLLADPKLDLTPYIYRALDFLKQELTYAGQYDDGSAGSDPAVLDAIELGRRDAGLPILAGPKRPSFIPDPGGAFGLLADGGSAGGNAPGFGAPGGTGPDGQPLANGVPAAQRQPERDAELPVPGSLLADDPTGGAYGSAGRPAGFGSGLPGISGFGAPDLAVPTNAGLFGTGTGLSGGVSGSSRPERPARGAKRRVPKRGK